MSARPDISQASPSTRSGGTVTPDRIRLKAAKYSERMTRLLLAVVLFAETQHDYRCGAYSATDGYWSANVQLEANVTEWTSLLTSRDQMIDNQLATAS